MRQADARSRRFRAVVLDYGGVLSYGPSPREIELLSRSFRVTPARFEPAYNRARGLYDRGDLSITEYWSGIGRESGIKLTPVLLERLGRADREMWGRVNPQMRDWFEKLRPAGYRTALLSNMPSDMIAHVRENFTWLASFDHQILSAEVRLVKPDPAIFQLCLDRLDVRAPEAIFVDDTKENVAGAQSLGFATILFRSVARLRRDLESIGFRPLPTGQHSVPTRADSGQDNGSARLSPAFKVRTKRDF